MTLLEVVKAVERIKERHEGLASHGVRLRPLHKRLDGGPGVGGSP